jgi:hypothetical protein
MESIFEVSEQFHDHSGEFKVIGVFPSWKEAWDGLDAHKKNLREKPYYEVYEDYVFTIKERLFGIHSRVVGMVHEIHFSTVVEGE